MSLGGFQQKYLYFFMEEVIGGLPQCLGACSYAAVAVPMVQ